MATLTTEDVKTLLPKVPYIEHDIPDPDKIRSLLVFLGIYDREQLEEFVAAKDVFEFLKDVYVHDLHRSPETLLDPTAVVVWGTMLFERGLSDDIKNGVIKKIRESDEYKKKHRYPSATPA